MRRRISRPNHRSAPDLEVAIEEIAAADIVALRARWREAFAAEPAQGLTKDILARALANDVQTKALGGLNGETKRLFRKLGTGTEMPRAIKVGAVIVREHEGVLHEVLIVPGGFCWRGKVYSSLSTIAREITGTVWNGPRFFGLRGKGGEDALPQVVPAEKGDERVQLSTLGRSSVVTRQSVRSPNGRPLQARRRNVEGLAAHRLSEGAGQERLP